MDSSNNERLTHETAVSDVSPLARLAAEHFPGVDLEVELPEVLALVRDCSKLTSFMSGQVDAVESERDDGLIIDDYDEYCATPDYEYELEAAGLDKLVERQEDLEWDVRSFLRDVCGELAKGMFTSDDDGDSEEEPFWPAVWVNSVTMHVYDDYVLVLDDSSDVGRRTFRLPIDEEAREELFELMKMPGDARGLERALYRVGYFKERLD
ncbi:hypothetical protein P7L87_26075 [Vibrio parahaemolyticus]|nr:hypothetical protein [Vibrio parahaemolyticus]